METTLFLHVTTQGHRIALYPYTEGSSFVAETMKELLMSECCNALVTSGSVRRARVEGSVMVISLHDDWGWSDKLARKIKSSLLNSIQRFELDVTDVQFIDRRDVVKQLPPPGAHLVGAI